MRIISLKVNGPRFHIKLLQRQRGEVFHLMKKPEIKADLKACETCRVGSCCYEGVELTNQEMRRIIKFNPAIPKPWFRLVTKEEKPDGIHDFSTIVRNGTCVFQDGKNFCQVYKVRPHYCRDFPLENNKTAPHYKRLCVLFHEHWPKSSPVRAVYESRENLQKKD